MNSYALGIDIGTTYTAAAVGRREADGALRLRPIDLGTRKSAVPTVVYLGEDGAVVVGEPAERRAIESPDRVVREFKRRIGDETPLIVGDIAVAPEDLFALLAQWVVERAEAQEGEPPASVALSYPAAWGAHRVESIRTALAGVGLAEVDLVSEPEAAGLTYLSEHELEDGHVIGVYDLGGGTFDVALLRREAAGDLSLVGAPRGIDRLGGSDFDQLVFDHVRGAAEDAFADLDAGTSDAVIALAAVRRECTEAKEALSFDAETAVPVILPSGQARVRLVRAEFEQLIESDLRRTVDTLRDAVAAAGLEVDDLSTVLLIGGSSRIPAVTQLISSELGVPVAIDADPKASISQGAAIAAGRRLEPAPGAEAVGATAAAAVVDDGEDVATAADEHRTGLPAWMLGAGSSPHLSMGMRTTLLAGAAAALLAVIVPITPLGAGGQQDGSTGGAAELEGSSATAAGRYVTGEAAEADAPQRAPLADDPLTRVDESEVEEPTGPLKPGKTTPTTAPSSSGSSSGSGSAAGEETSASGQTPGGGSTTDPTTDPTPDPAPDPAPDPTPTRRPTRRPTPRPTRRRTPRPSPSPHRTRRPSPSPHPIRRRRRSPSRRPSPNRNPCRSRPPSRLSRPSPPPTPRSRARTMTPSPRTDAVPPAVSGWSDAEHLVRMILRGSDRVVAGVTGPGGSGKSTLLDRVAAELRAGGARVFDGLDAGVAFDTRTAETPVVVLVDEAEQLPAAHLSLLDRVLGDELVHLVLAFRPSPSVHAAEVLERAGRRHSTVVLHPLTAAEVAARSVALLGTAASPAVVTRVLDLTAGNPRLVDLAFIAIRDDGWDLDPAADLPGQVLETVARELDGLDRLTREFVLALAVGFSASGPALATAPRFAHADTLALMQNARADGLASADGRLPPLVRTAVLRTALPDEAWSLRRELVDAIEAAGMPLDDAALSLAAQGHRDRRIAAALERSGDEYLAIDPAEAGRRYAAAVEAGADRTSLEARRAHAAWAAGDVRDAERLVDRLLGRGESPDVCRGIEVAAAVWARQGLLRRSAEAYERLAGEQCALMPLAVVALAATGELERASALRASEERVAYPTSSHMALDLMAEGLIGLCDDDSERALASLLSASSVMSEAGAAIALPEVPAVLAAQVALALGELRIADEVLSAAIAGTQGGPAFTARLQLMRGLVALRADRPLHAREHLTAAMADAATRPLGLRDDVLASALRVGLARHQGEIPGLVRAWEAARQVIAGMRPDLTTLPALAELVVAAARLGDMHLIETHLSEAWQLLDELGRPSPLTISLHWTEIESALLRNDTATVEHHADSLDARADDRTARRLARAARTWASALAGEVDVESVERAARDLSAAGYPWDAARLAGHAAARAAEHQDSLRLLALARSLHPDESRSVPGARSATTAHSASAALRPPEQDGTALSTREREVARLVLEGKTYAEIGETIFISPRTAEHHIARIRRRLGATNRSDLMSKLRAALDADTAP